MRLVISTSVMQKQNKFLKLLFHLNLVFMLKHLKINDYSITVMFYNLWYVNFNPNFYAD
jgi:hypothetical protein